ncbi:hypothetical protein E4N85_06245 [Treponema denticola]|uniref:Glycosyl transferase family 8 C-terminal domain-containing protein n=1 Tax=Treponema denticola OTK TaxID=999434 RepID=A0A0F6MMH7_TREDN|nr:glycosyltransferase [Treponema denticola]EMB19802.1 hypothetical protein HMPREF9723_02499 [Treponema denticola OTK]EMB21424.1 hypothetical protein HMPREF9724_02054 [Treponema denticola SP37]EPF32948.1 hypothetical protein HMPREF9734_02271 [Treponema denticola SP44]EPF40425.1 hypothetical protein HMPREF9731_00287 [Treponema denticola SP23]UTC95350.1 hypothetical protein E4N85_06245 [Treponema denticola]
MKKKTAIVTGGTSNDVPAMACLVMNIKDTNPNLADEIVILHDGISEKDQKLINSIFPTRFIFYESPFEKISGFQDVVTKYFSLMVFCRYECFRLLEDYETVIWTDYDVVILQDLSELKKNTDSGMIFSYTLEPLSSQFYPTISQVINTEFDLTKKGICIPIFVLNHKIKDYLIYYQWLIENTPIYAEHLLLPEVAVVNLLLQKFNLNFDAYITNKYYAHPVTDKDMQDIKILHAYGLPKFWDGMYNKTWEKNYKKWIKMGGSPYEHRTLKSKIKRTFLYRGLRKVLRPFVK